MAVLVSRIFWLHFFTVGGRGGRSSIYSLWLILFLASLQSFKTKQKIRLAYLAQDRTGAPSLSQTCDGSSKASVWWLGVPSLKKLPSTAVWAHPLQGWISGLNAM